MFTGLVEERGSVVECVVDGRTAKLTVNAPFVHNGVKIGDSVAVNGCCLTVIAIDGDQLTFDAMPETLRRTNLGELTPGCPVNLERPLAADGRFGGHFVQGHVDGVGVVKALRTEENAVVIDIAIPDDLGRYFVEKGSVAIDGVSMTVAGLSAGAFSIWTIPHTREMTTLGLYAVGDRVNLECDMLGKYIERLLATRFDDPESAPPGARGAAA